MPALTSNVHVRYFGGAVTCAMNVHSATATKQRNVEVCLGGEAAAHDPVRVTTKKVCAECGDIHGASTSKARQVGESYVVLTEEDVATATGDAAQFKKTMDLLPHPTQQVSVATAPGEKLYYLQPVQGFEPTYALLATLIERHPEITFLTRFTPRTAMAVFSLHVVPDPTGRAVIVMRERVAGDQLKAAPDFTTPLADEAFTALGEQYLTGGGVVDFDLATYRDDSESKLAELIAGRAGVPLNVPGTTPVTVEASRAGLEAAVAALGAPAKPVRKRTRKAAVKAVTEPATVS